MPTPRRSLLAIVASATLLGTMLLPVSAAQAATTDVATEAELTAAIASAASGDTVRLSGDIGSSSTRIAPVIVSVDLTLDLNGHQLFGEAIAIQESSETDFTIDDLSAAGDGLLDLKFEIQANSNVSAAIAATHGHLTIAGGTILATSTGRGTAAIGGWFDFSLPAAYNENILITGGTVIASATTGAAIGVGPNELHFGNYVVRITGGSVTATSVDGAGIGASSNGNARPKVSIEGGEVTARSTNGAGIGSGSGGTIYSPQAGPVSITESAVVDARSVNGAGIGGGVRGNATSTLIGAGAHVTAFSGAIARGGPAIGAGYDAISPDSAGFHDGSITVDGTLHLPTNTFVRSVIASPAGSVVNTIGEAGLITGSGEIRAQGVWNNKGRITLDDARIKAKDINFNHFTVSFDVQGVGTAPTMIRVFAPTFTSGDRTLPALPNTSGWVFDGWNTAADGSGTAFTANTVMTPLTEIGGVDGTAITLYAQWHPTAIDVTATPTTTAAGTSIALSASCVGTANEDLGDCTERVVFTSDVASDTITGDTVLVTEAGPRTFTGTLTLPDGNLTDTTTATVTPGAAVSLTLASPAATTVAGTSMVFTTTAVDAHGNETDVTSTAVLTSDQSGDTVSGNEITLAAAGDSVITTTWEGLTATKAIEVTAAPTPGPSTHDDSPPKALPSTGNEQMPVWSVLAALLIVAGVTLVLRKGLARTRE